MQDTKQLRAFGLIVGGGFTIIGLWPLLVRNEPLRIWAIALAVILVSLALGRPNSLSPAYRVWMALGHVLGWINTRIILGVIFYGLITPVGFVRRFLLGKDSMRRKFEPGVETYRVKRQPRPRSHMQRQF